MRSLRFSALAFCAALLLSVPALAAWTPANAQQVMGTWSEAQALTRAIPAIATATDWVPLTGIRAFDVEVCAESGQTLSGAGSLQCYRKGAVAALRNPSLDLNITVTATSCAGAPCRCQTFPNFKTAVGIGAFMFAASAVTVSGGTTVTVKITTTAQQAMLLPRVPELRLALFNPNAFAEPNRPRALFLGEFA